MKKLISIIILAAFISTSVKSPAYAQSDQQGMIPFLPVPGVRVHLSPEFTSAYLQGITTHPDNALQFDFLIHKGDQDLEGDQKAEEYKKLVKYFLASLTIPDEDQWVNLSPYEKDRIIKDDFGKTEMGRDLLAEDYLLKQITSSLIYPEDGLGKKFWDKVYERAWNEYRTTEIPVDTFNKVWIVPDQAYVYESGNSAYILKSHLKVMLEEDYLSLEKHNGIIRSPSANNTHAIGSQVIREIILPELEKEVNEGKNFANLRQMYSGMILATWYKRVLRESLLGKVYADKARVKGVDQDPKNNEEIYQRYLKAFKKGVFNYIKEDVDKYTNEAIPRKYFSGGFVREKADRYINSEDLAMMGPDEKESIDAALMSEGSREDVAKVNFLGTQGAGVEQKDLRDIARKLVNFFNLKYSRDNKLPYFYLSDNKEKIVTTWLIENHLPALSVEEMRTVRGFAGLLLGNTEGGGLLLAALGNLSDKAMTANIVVVSSDPNLRRMIKSDLETPDVNVLPVASPSALEQSMKSKVNLLVIDTRTAWVSPSIAAGNIPTFAFGLGLEDMNAWKKKNTTIFNLPFPAKEFLGKVHEILSRDKAMTANNPEEVSGLTFFTPATFGFAILLRDYLYGDIKRYVDNNLRMVSEGKGSVITLNRLTKIPGTFVELEWTATIIGRIKKGLGNNISSIEYSPKKDNLVIATNRIVNIEQFNTLLTLILAGSELGWNKGPDAAMLSPAELKLRIKAIDLLSGLLNSWSAGLSAREGSNRSVGDSKIILIRETDQVSRELLGSVEAVSKMVAEATGSDTNMESNFVAFINKNDLTFADLKFRAERVALKLTELRTSYVNYLPGHPEEVAGLLERMQSLHNNIANFITENLPGTNHPDEVLGTTLSGINEILYNFIHTTATKQTAVIVLDDLNQKLNQRYLALSLSHSTSDGLKIIKDEILKLITSIEEIVSGAHAQLVGTFGYPIDKNSFARIKFWSGNLSSAPYQWLTTTEADSQEIFEELQRAGFISDVGEVMPILTDNTAEDDLKLDIKFKPAARAILNILHVAKKSPQDTAMTAQERDQEFQKVLTALRESASSKLQANESLQKEIDGIAGNKNIPYITRFLEIKDQITNAVSKEGGVFHDGGVGTKYTQTLVKRIKNILYGTNLLIVGSNPFSTILRIKGGFYGLDVTTAVNGIEAANILHEEPAKFKAIIFDIDNSLERKRLVNLMRLYPGLSKIPMVLTGDFIAHKDFFASLNNKNIRFVDKKDSLPVFSTLADLVEDAAMTSEPIRAQEDTIIKRALFYWIHNEDSPVGKMPPEFVRDFRAVLEGEKSIDDVTEKESNDADKRTIKRILVSGWLGAKYDLQAGQLGLYGFLAQRDGYKQWQGSRQYLIQEYLPKFTKFPAQKIVEEAENMMSDEAMNTSELSKGGIDFNAANLNLQIKRDGRGVPLPLAQQDMGQLMQIQGFVPVIIEIKPAFNVPILSELQQKLQPAST